MFEKDSIVDEFTISVGGEFHLNEEMSFEDIIFEAVKFGYNKANEWHYPSKMENGRYIADNPVADFYPIEILALYLDKNEYEIIKYDSSWAYYKKNGESLSSKTNFVWRYL